MASSPSGRPLLVLRPLVFATEELVSTEYRITTFVRQTPNPLLEQYFQRFDGLAGFDFRRRKQKEVTSFLKVIDQIRPEARAGIEADFGDIFLLCNEEGRRIIIEQLRVHEPDVLATLSLPKSPYAVAMWLFLRPKQAAVDLFDECCSLAELNQLTSRAAHRLSGIPALAPDTSPEALENLRQALITVYEKQARAYSCDIRLLRRYEPDRFYFLLSPEDYATSDRQFHGRHLRKVQRRSPFHILYAFCPELGTLDLSGSSISRDREPLHEIFCRLVLHLPSTPVNASPESLHLAPLLSPGFVFDHSPGDQIEEVVVTGVKLANRRNPEQAVAFEQDPTLRESVHPWMTTVLGQASPDLDLELCGATIRVHFRPGSRGRKGPLTFTLNSSDSLLLREKRDEPWVRRMLNRWKLVL